MICKKCGNQLNDNALFCPKCGQRIETQTQDINRNVQPNINNVNPAGNVRSEAPPKKKHTVRTVLLSIVGTIVVMFGGLMWLGSQASNSVETGSSAVSAPSEQRETGGDIPTSSEGISNEVPSQDALNDTVSSQDSINELLGYIDQAEEFVTKAWDDYSEVDNEEDDVERYKMRRDIIATLLSDLSPLQQQANAVKGLDANLATAGKEYFNMLCDSEKAHYEIMNFFTGYFNFMYTCLFLRPEGEGFGTEEHCNELYDWYQSAKEEYLAFDSYPPCLEGEWKRYGEILDLNESIAFKEYQAIQSNDWLRLYSAIYMSNRYETVEELQYEEFINCFKGEVNLLNWQRGISSKLADEIHAYAEMDEQERRGYEFEYVRTNKILLDYESIDTIYPALYNTYNAFVIIKTGCASGSRKIIVEAEIPGFTQKYQESFTLDSAYRAIYIKPPALTGDLDLTSAKDAQISVTISEQDGTVIDTKSFPVKIQSKYDVDWYTDEYGIATKDNILCYLTPESPAITQLKRVAIDEMSAMTNGSMESIVGYQSTGFNHYVGTYLQAAGIMRALYEMGVRYNADSFSLSDGHQHVLLPADVLEQKSGLCIETSLTVASALQSAGMHAFIVLPPGHAQVAVEIWNGNGEDTSGTGQYFLIETTALSDNWNNQNVFINDANALLEEKVLNSSPIIYMNADTWYEYLSAEGTYVIDCDDSRVLGLTPFTN